jgi:hypothetical protein
LPIEPPRTACVSTAKRNDDELNTGTFASAAIRKIVAASRNDPAIGLSIKTGLPAFNTGLTCSRWGRPSTLSSSTPSTFRHKSSMLSYIVTLYFSCNVLV